jgi:hypothetical protein
LELPNASKKYIEKKLKAADKQRKKRRSREFAVAQQKRIKLKKEERENRKLDINDGITGTYLF